MRKRSPSVAVAVFASCALIALLVYGVMQREPSRAIDDAIAAGDRLPAPAREVPLLGSRATASLADFRGKIVVLNVWASWCKPCADEAPALEAVHRRYRDRGVTVVGADMDDATGDALRFVRRFHLTYPNLRYTSDQVAKDFGTTQLPETFVIDRSGRIAAASRTGQITEPQLTRMIEPLLDERR